MTNPPHGSTIDWDRLRNRPLTPAEKRAVRQFYSDGYHERSNYNARHPWLQQIADYRARLLLAVFPRPGKVLDGGCAAGQEVVTLRQHGVEAWGFDVAPDLHEFAYPEAAPFVRIGPMNAIPYSASDGFTTFVSHDAIEHVPIDALERLPSELHRLGVTQVSCIVSADTESPGHITIQDLPWYEALFARAGYRLMREITAVLQDVLAPVAWNDQRNEPIIAPYIASGRPRNGWNQVPGHCFFVRG